MPKIKENHNNNSYQIFDLNYNTTYYWKIVAKDVKGGVTNGPIWSFTTNQSGDIAKAKALISDLRNIVLTIHDYKGIGVPGIVDTPFQRFSEEIEEKIVPDLSETMQRVGFIINCISQTTGSGTFNFTYTEMNYNLTITQVENQSCTFEGYISNEKIDEGSIIVQFNNNNQLTSGNINATMKTKDGNLVVGGNFNATYFSDSNPLKTLSIKGNITSSYLNIDFNQTGLYVEFGEFYDTPKDRYLPYLVKLQIGGKITTTTIQAEGNLIGDGKLVNLPNNATNNPPTNISFTGTFREMKDGSPTGAYFTGTISAQNLNPDDYNPHIPDGPDNYSKWQASFNGHIEAPKRPKIDANLSILHDEYQLYKIQAGYERTNPDGSKVWLKTYQEAQSYYNEGIEIMEVYMKNQDNLTLYFKVDGNETGDNTFTGCIKNNIGANLADLYLQSGIPMVRYSDGYIESIF
ncbi:MAG: hypothetical protein CBR30_08440 [Dictyoglomus sp. NZ13-RE01]|nr:MAG: hypothetical protein CBR30_08440 [Dictyoglomus sp. NZ13-RE01]